MPDSIRLFYFQKKKIYWVKELSKSKQTRYGVSHVYLERKTKTIFGIACLEKKVRISIGNFDLFGYSIFKNIEILLIQRIVQIKANMV